MTIEYWIGLAFGMGAWIVVDAWIKRRAGNATQEPPKVPAKEHHRVTFSDAALHVDPLVWYFDSEDERKAFVLGVEAGRDVTITALRARHRLSARDDLDFTVSTRRVGPEKVEP